MAEITVDRRWLTAFVVATALLLVLLATVGYEVSEMRTQTAVLIEQIKTMHGELEEIRLHGSPITDKRLTVLEFNAGITSAK